MQNVSHHLRQIKDTPEFTYHNLLRDYLKHEDDLINQRITWHLTIQAFLIATYSWTLQKLLEIQQKYVADSKSWGSITDVKKFPAYDPLIWLCILLCVLGLVMAICAHFGIEAAREAIKQLHEDWNVRVRGFKTHHHWASLNRDEPLYLPDVIRGGCGRRKMHEHLQMLGTSWLFGVGWLAAGLFLLRFWGA